MSKLITNTIRHTGGSADNITLDNSQNVTVEGALTVDGTLTASNFSGRNKVINGGMQVWQRSTSVAGAGGSNGYFAADRMRTSHNGAARYTLSRSTDSPNEFGYSMKFDCTTAEASPGATNYVFIQHRIEAQNLQNFAKGTADAKQYTLSFWVKATKTGINIVELYDADNSRVISKSYTVSSANTWEKKTITFPADTTGAITNDNGHGMCLYFWLMTGSNYNSGTLATSWGSMVAANRAVGQVNNFDNTSNDFYITGIQLEETAATEFEHRSYGDELARCQRYYYRHVDDTNDAIGVGGWYTASLFTSYVGFPTTMRSAPTLEKTSGSDYYRVWSGGTNQDGDDLAMERNSITGCVLDFGTNLSGTAGNPGNVNTNNAAAKISFNAEL